MNPLVSTILLWERQLELPRHRFEGEPDLVEAQDETAAADDATSPERAAVRERLSLRRGAPLC